MEKLYWTERAVANKKVFSLVHFAFLAMIFFGSVANGQTVPILEREITMSLTNEKLDVALTKLSQQGKFTFSYNSAIIDANKTVSLSVTRKTVREILNQLFNGTILYKQKGNYIILTKAPNQSPKTSAIVPPLIISGYAIHGETGEKIPEVSIYDKKSLTAAITNSYGFFKLKIDKPEPNNSLSINKRGFKDTIVVVPQGADAFLNIALSPEIPVIVATAQESDLSHDSLTVTPMAPNEEEEKRESQVNMENIKDTIYRDYQVSLVPFVGTNDKLSGNVISDYSFNFFGGYTLGTRRVEVGGLFNIDRGDVQHTQVAGLFNLIGGSSRGFQGAGLFNITERKTDAVQVAGLFNLNESDARGVLVAGLGNFQPGDYRGSQIAGLLNVSNKKVDGTQVAGLLNYGRNVRGSQIGFLNISDSIRGVPIGFMSLVNHGYHKIEISADEIFYTNLAFRTGVHQFYNIFAAGIKPDNFSQPFWTVGYGLGTAPKISKWLYLNVDLTTNQVSQGSFTPAINLLNKLYVGFDVQPLKKMSITFGVTLNGYVTDTAYEPGYPDLFTSYRPNIIYDQTYSNNINLKMWWGAKVGLRFL